MRCRVKGCRGPVKPDITFFGEQVAEEFMDKLQNLKDCDLLLVIGTSLAVKPFNSIIDEVKESCPKVLINLENTNNYSYNFNNTIQHPERLWLQGKCDDVIK